MGLIRVFASFYPQSSSNTDYHKVGPFPKNLPSYFLVLFENTLDQIFHFEIVDKALSRRNDHPTQPPEIIFIEENHGVLKREYKSDKHNQICPQRNVMRVVIYQKLKSETISEKAPLLFIYSNRFLLSTT
jgi:hypothetical protein